jgi:23S rRNA pseudouridine2605 synthase
MTDQGAKSQADRPAGERIAKVLARAGVASRRASERLIGEGRVAVNGKVIDTPVTLVTDQDRVEVDGKPLAAREKTSLWLYHKPVGLVTTAKDPQGRPTVFENLPADLPRVVSVGRLDLNSEGLLLLTNDGGLAGFLAHPSTGWKRRYRVRAFGPVNDKSLAQLRRGVTVKDVKYAPIEIDVESQRGSNTWFDVGLKEGKNREIRRLFEHIDLKVNRLIRVAFGPFQLGNLKAGEVRKISGSALRQQLGRKYKLDG